MAGVRASELLKALAAGAFADALRPVLKGFANPSFSQFGEDVALLAQHSGAGPGVYVDVGAFHPTLYSNTFAFYLRGWRGVLIEPNPRFHRLIRRLRPRDRLVPCGVSGAPARLTYYEYADPAFNTFSTEQAEGLEARGRAPDRTTAIETRPLRQILAGADCPPRFDLMSVDCEGYDLEVLESNDWSSYRPALIVVEDHQLYNAGPGAGQGSDIGRLLDGEGYALASMIKYSAIYRDRSA